MGYQKGFRDTYIFVHSELFWKYVCLFKGYLIGVKESGYPLIQKICVKVLSKGTSHTDLKYVANVPKAISLSALP